MQSARPTACIVFVDYDSASTAAFEKGPYNLDLVSGDQGRCMAAILHDVRTRIAVPAQHACEDIFRKKVGFFSPHHQDGNVDSIPIFPEVHAIVPRISERVRNVGIAQ
jgi:hypothetical protein